MDARNQSRTDRERGTLAIGPANTDGGVGELPSATKG